MMELVIGKRKFTVKPYTIRKVLSTNSVGFKVSENGTPIEQFDQLIKLGMWVASIIIDETFEEELEK